ncbi:MAG: peptide ABC transporter substrate-binding protein [Acidobacteriota bacterium]
MNILGISKIRILSIMVAVASLFVASCSNAGSNRYFGKTIAPKDNVLRYVTGPEPESLDPQLPDGQPEARIYMALYDGLVEYGPKDMQPIPAIAKSWEISPRLDEFLFHLRDDAKWSDGAPITARDFVYSLRRGLRPETISRTSYLGYVIKYAEEFNGGKVFVKKGDSFLLAKDFGRPEKEPGPPLGPETTFHTFITSHDRLTLDGDATKRAATIAADPKLKAATEGAEFVPVSAEDIGVEAVDNYTLRITLRQSAPYFLSMLPHQFFRLVPEKAIEKYKKEWTRPEHIVTCGAFRIKNYRPYDALVLEKDPNYWDAANVHLDGLEFLAVEELTTIMNLYKAGDIDAFQNHVVPSPWVDEIRQYKDEYLNFPENSTAYYAMNMTKPPFNDVRVRRAFNLSVDNDGLSAFRKVTKPLYSLAPSFIIPEYDAARAKVSEDTRKERGVSSEEWAKNRRYDPEQAREVLTEAGYPVVKDGESYSCPSFPLENILITFNSNESNRATAEFVQAQWKQNLGITIPLKTMEFKTYSPYFKSLQYEGFGVLLWSGDFMDPYTFLALEAGRENQGGSGFYDPKYDKMLDDANSELDPAKRYELLARAEAYLMEQLPAIPLTIGATDWMKKPYVKGLYPSPGTLLPWKFVYIEQDTAKWDKDVENILVNTDPVVERQLQDLKSTQPVATK